MTPDTVGGVSKATTTSDSLFIGTESNILAYDVERNADLFYRETQDGVNAITVGKLSNQIKPLVIIGGNCSILGFDNEGNEVFWTVSGDNITSLALFDVDGDGLNELLVGSQDYEIRVFQNEEVKAEITEADKVSFLWPIQGKKFAYGLVNGTVGVYSGIKNRQWRVKTKNKVTSLCSFDLDHDGVPEVVTGWSNGTFNVRKLETGELVFKETIGSAVSGIITSDYRLDGKEQLMICSQSGEVRGYLPSTEIELVTMSESGIEKSQGIDQKVLEDLQQKKIELSNELKQLTSRLETIKTSGDIPLGALPLGTSLSYSLVPDALTSCVSLRVAVNTEVQIANIIAIDLGKIQYVCT